MSNCQIRVVMALFLLSVVTPSTVCAKRLGMALTPLEQADRLSNVANQVANQAIVGKLFPPAAETITSKSFYQRNYRTAWRSASPSHRVRLAEKIGTQGAERYAAKQGWIKLLGSQGRSIPQGPDSIYWDRNSGRVRVVEAKGGTAPLKWTYGSKQGTNLNTLRSAEFALKSAKTRTEKLQAARVIKAAQNNHLETRVVRTAHILGKPQPPQLEGRNTDNVRKEAVRIERELRGKSLDLAKVFKEAGTVQRVARLKYFAAKGMRYAGRWVLPIVASLEGLRAGMTAYDYASGRMSQRDLYRRSLGPAIFATFTVSGAIVGGGIQGAFIGAMVAVPAQFAGDWMLNRYYQKFDERQRRLVDAVVEKSYELGA